MAGFEINDYRGERRERLLKLMNSTEIDKNSDKNPNDISTMDIINTVTKSNLYGTQDKIKQSVVRFFKEASQINHFTAKRMLDEFTKIKSLYSGIAKGYAMEAFAGGIESFLEKGIKVEIEGNLRAIHDYGIKFWKNPEVPNRLCMVIDRSKVDVEFISAVRESDVEEGDLMFSSMPDNHNPYLEELDKINSIKIVGDMKGGAVTLYSYNKGNNVDLIRLKFKRVK
ncbi:MAG: hypothetical protein ABIH00_00630 [Armatimonadota bacterium]